MIGAGLFLAGVLLNNNEEEKNQLEQNNPSIIVNINNDDFVKPFPKNYYDNYKSKIFPDSTEFLYNNISNLYENSVEPGSKVVNNIWRILNDNSEKEKKFKINNLLNKDINMIKKTSYNNIETMNNINTNNNYYYDSDDSQFSDNYSLPTTKLGKKNKTSKRNKIDYKVNKSNSIGKFADDYISGSGSDSDNYSDNDTNINTKVLNQQDKFFSDVITNLSGYDSGSDIEPTYSTHQSTHPQSTHPQSTHFQSTQSGCQSNSFESQFDELKFDHDGIPGTIQNGKQMLNIFNDKMGWAPQSDFNPKSDGRYGVTGDMTHNNMVPFFSSKTYGYNPMYDKERENYSVRQIELFTGSDQNPQFKHKTEVGNLFSPVTNKVDSVTGVPNFNDFFESRYIPSQTRNGERPFEPIRTTPGLNLGYNQIGNTGRQDLYRVLPRTVDQLRTVNNPKVSYTPLLNPAHKGERRGIVGDFIQKGPDRFYYNSPDSMLPQVGDHVAPAIYGKWIVNQTNRSLNPDTPALNPLGGNERSTPEYLQGQFKRSFKREDEALNPANVKYDTRGQIINQETWIPNETNRQTTNFGDNFAGNVIGNKSQSYLENFDNAVPDTTLREITPELPNANIIGNHKSIPLINFLNFIPDVTKRQILLEDNGRKNLTNISNSIKGYLFNSINAIQDPTLRDLISQKIILTNQKGPQEQNYLFNMTNAIKDPNMRNLSEDNLILTNLSNHEQGYLFNNINAIPDPTLRDLINTLYGRGGFGMKDPEMKSQLFNYSNAIPDTTLRELTENIIQLTNITGPVGSVKQYLFNYIDGIPDTTLRELTQDKIVLTGLKPIQVKEYLFNYIDGIPDTTLRELTENTVNLIGQKGSHQQDYMFNYMGGIPDATMRELIEELREITNLTGNHKAQYLLNYVNAIPDTTLRELTENKEVLTNLKPIQVREYLYNYINAIPDTTLKELTENQKHIIGAKGSHTQDYMFNYAGGIPDITNRAMTENTVNLTGQKGSHTQDYMFNYASGVPDMTNRAMTENTVNLTGQKGNRDAMVAFNYDDRPDLTMRNLSEGTKNITGQGSQYAHKEYLFNYAGGVPDDTNRNQTGGTKNITGQKGDGVQSRSRLDYSNALLNNVKEVVAQGRAPTTVKDNKGPTCAFTEYTFTDDRPLAQRPIYSTTKTIGNIPNQLYTFA